jgi:pimeloyl-ACP methyl ester carboxylesterase
MNFRGRHDTDRDQPHRALQGRDQDWLSLRRRRALGSCGSRSTLHGRRLAAFARALSEHFTVHTIERRGRGESGPQGDDYSIVKECEDVLALQAETGAALLVGHSYGGLVALEVARNNRAFSRIAVYEPGVSDGPPRIQKTPRWLMKLNCLCLSAVPASTARCSISSIKICGNGGKLPGCDSSCEHYREVGAGVLLMYGGKSG